MNLYNISFKLPPSETNSDDSRIFPAKWISRFYNPVQQQQSFSLPDSLIFHITKNPASSNLYQKMIQTCKYFFAKIRILLISDFESSNPLKIWNTKFNKKEISDYSKIPCKFWLIEKLGIYNRVGISDFDKNFVLYVKQKIYKSDIKMLNLSNQNISFDNFVFLASKCDGIDMDNVLIKNDDGSIVPFEKIIAVVPELENFFFANIYENFITQATVEEMLKLPHFLNLKNVTLWGISDDFNIEDFFVYAKGNTKTHWDIEFSEEISDQFKIRVGAVVDEIVQTQNHTYRIPVIEYPEMDEDTFNAMNSLTMTRIL